jgi:branched-chain amino acid aminotransferase
MISHMGSFAPKYDSGVSLMIPAQQTLPAHLVDLKAKTRSRIHYRMAELQAARSGEGCLPLLLDPAGYLAEGSGWNVFLVKNGILCTPEPRNILQGISREETIRLARSLGIEVQETNLGRYEALMADEMFCTATTYSLVHANSIEGRTIGDGKPGPVFQKLQQAWIELVGIDFVAQAHDYAGRLESWLENDMQQEAVH